VEDQCHLPPGARHPRKGDVYEALHDIEMDFLTSWLAPYTGSGKGILKRGERIVVKEDPAPGYPGVYMEADNYRELEARMVPEAERTHYKFSHFYFSVLIKDLYTKFRLVAELPPPLIGDQR
jgi:hypothetical protein